MRRDARALSVRRQTSSALLNLEDLEVRVCCGRNTVPRELLVHGFLGRTLTRLESNVALGAFPRAVRGDWFCRSSQQSRPRPKHKRSSLAAAVPRGFDARTVYRTTTTEAHSLPTHPPPSPFLPKPSS